MTHSKCSLQINLNIIKENYNLLRNLCASEVGAAVKANAYGLGVSQIAPVLRNSGCKHFFVSCLDEGIEIRKIIGKDPFIYVLHGVFKNEPKIFVEYNLIPVLNHLIQVELWQNYASSLSRKLPCIIHVDTGMHRLGMPKLEIEAFKIEKDAVNLDVLYIMSHLSSAEDIKNPENKNQLDKFKEYTKQFSRIKKSLANSSGIFLGKDYHFDLVRPGAALYGLNPAPYLKDSKIKNPVKLFAPIIQIHNLPSGESVGYNCTYNNVEKNSVLIATIPVGYADGFSRAFSNKGEVYIDGFKAPIIGRVSMDLITINVSNIPTEKLFLGAQIELIGDHCKPEQIAQLIDTNGYEVLTMLGNRYEYVYN